MEQAEKIDSRLKRIENILHEAKKQGKKSIWVKSRWIKNLTGWNYERFREARKQRIVEWRKTKEGGMEYDLSTLPEIFILKKKPEL